MALGRFVTAETLSEILIKKHGLPFSAERLKELAAQGFLPSSTCDGHGPLFKPIEAKRWIKEHLMVNGEGSPYPTEIAVFDVRQWWSTGREVPAELSLIEANLREVPAGIFRWPCGIYFLVQAGRVVYVGQSINLVARLVDHTSRKRFDRIFFLPVPQEHLTNIETGFIRRLQPELNGDASKSWKAQDYHIDLDKWYSDQREEEIERLDRYHEERHQAYLAMRPAKKGLPITPAAKR